MEGPPLPKEWRRRRKASSSGSTQTTSAFPEPVQWAAGTKCEHVLWAGKMDGQWLTVLIRALHPSEQFPHFNMTPTIQKILTQMVKIMPVTSGDTPACPDRGFRAKAPEWLLRDMDSKLRQDQTKTASTTSPSPLRRFGRYLTGILSGRNRSGGSVDHS